MKLNLLYTCKIPPSVPGTEKALRPGNNIAVVVTTIVIVRNITSLAVVSGDFDYVRRNFEMESCSAVLMFCSVFWVPPSQPNVLFLKPAKVYDSIRIKNLVIAMNNYTPNLEQGYINLYFHMVQPCENQMVYADTRGE